MDAFKNLFRSKPKTQLKEIIVVLRYSRHCEHCSVEVKRSCEKMKGVSRVVLDDENALVMVEGSFDVDKLVKYIRHRNDKIVTIVEQRSVIENNDEDGSSSRYTSRRGGRGRDEDGSSSWYTSYRGRHGEDGSSTRYTSSRGGRGRDEDGSSSMYTSYRGGRGSSEDDLESYHRYR